MALLVLLVFPFKFDFYAALKWYLFICGLTLAELLRKEEIILQRKKGLS